MGACDHVKDAHMRGKHSYPDGGLLNIQSLVTRNSSDIMPQYKECHSFFEDSDHADSILIKKFGQTFPLNDALAD